MRWWIRGRPIQCCRNLCWPACAPRRQLGFVLADGSRVQYGFGIARFRIDDAEMPCPVIFGPEGSYLLGASALEVFNLMADP